MNGKTVTETKSRVATGALVDVVLDDAPTTDIMPESIPLDIVHEDSALIVVNKPAGLVVHPAPGTPTGTLVNALLHHFRESLSDIGSAQRPGIVHRIDKETSGLLVVAKTNETHMRLAEQFAAHTVERHYRAFCFGVPSAATPRLRGIRFEPGNIVRIATGLARHRHDRQRQTALLEGGRHAVTHARVVETFGSPPAIALIDCWLETGRTHQIRVHLAYAGHRLVGDQVYGRRKKTPKQSLPAETIKYIEQFPRQALHAATLGFEHPVSGEQVRFEAPFPQDLDDLLGVLQTGFPP